MWITCGCKNATIDLFQEKLGERIVFKNASVQAFRLCFMWLIEVCNARRLDQFVTPIIWFCSWKRGRHLNDVVVPEVLFYFMLNHVVYIRNSFYQGFSFEGNKYLADTSKKTLSKVFVY